MSGLGGLGQKSALVVGCLPFMATSDVSVERRDVAGKTWYAFAPAPGLRERVADALAALDRSGAQLGVVPEYTLDDKVLSSWQAAIVATPPSETSRLRLVLVGTGPMIGAATNGQPSNRAVVLDRFSGRPVLEQDKQTAYEMPFADLEPWTPGRSAFGSPLSEVAHEWMHEGTILSILEHPPIRLAVLVCEDLSVSGRLMARVRAWGVTHVLAPVLSRPLEATRTRGFGWEANSARAYANRAGCHVVVSNSLAHPESAPPRRPITSLAYSPASPDPRYVRPGLPATRRSRRPVQVALFSLA